MKCQALSFVNQFWKKSLTKSLSSLKDTDENEKINEENYEKYGNSVETLGKLGNWVETPGDEMEMGESVSESVAVKMERDEGCDDDDDENRTLMELKNLWMRHQIS